MWMEDKSRWLKKMALKRWREYHKVGRISVDAMETEGCEQQKTVAEQKHHQRGEMRHLRLTEMKGRLKNLLFIYSFV